MYALHVDVVEANERAEFHALVAAVAAGAEGVEVPPWGTARRRLDDALAAPLPDGDVEGVQDERSELLEVLGLTDRR